MNRRPAPAIRDNLAQAPRAARLASSWGASRSVEALAAALLVSRLLTPTEGAAQGSTLAIAAASFAGLALCGLEAWRGAAIWPRFNAADGLVVGLCLSPAVSAVLNQWAGETRAMINLVCEWGGLLATWFILRQALQRQSTAARLWLAIVAAAVVLSAFGIWQHLRGHEQSRAQYRQIRDRLGQLESAGRPAEPRAAAVWQQEVLDLQWKLMEMGVPADGRGRALWEARLEGSSEPLGLFALANTFAGLLLAAAVVLLVLLAMQARAVVERNGLLLAPRASLLAGAACLLLLLYVLLLTKSRSAMVAMAAAAVGQLAWVSAGLPVNLRRKLLAAGAVALLIAAGLAAATYATGGIDRQVFTQAARSLRYRAEYWQATLGVLFAQDAEWAWLRGVGPGNFRTRYLRHKLPESSEEIADPHNLFLDAWCSAGLPAVMCLAGMVALLAARGVRAVRGAPPAAGPPADSTAKDQARGGGLSHAAGAAVAFIAVALHVAAYDEQLAWLLSGMLFCWIVVERLLNRFAADAGCGAAAAWSGLALVVHLLAAGGLAMPALSQVLLLAFAGTMPGQSARREADSSRVAGLAIAVAGLALAAGCLNFVLVPNLRRDAALAAGDEELYARHNAEAAGRAYRQALRHDPYSTSARERLAELATLQWQARRDSSDEEFAKAVEARRLVIASNPASHKGFRDLGELYLARFEQTRNPRDASAAADAFAQAVERYPTNSALVAQLAVAHKQAGSNPAATLFAQKALWLDAVNRAQGHVDKYLPAKMLQLLQEISEAELTTALPSLE